MGCLWYLVHPAWCFLPHYNNSSHFYIYFIVFFKHSHSTHVIRHCIAGLQIWTYLILMTTLKAGTIFFSQMKKQRATVQFSHSVVSDSLQPHGHARPPCPSPTSRVYSNSCPLSQWCHPTISSSVVPFSSCPQSFPASGSFQMSQFFTSGGQSIGVSASASVLPVNIQDRFPLGWTGWISLLSKGLSRVFSSTTVQEYQFFSVQPSLWSNSHIHTWLLGKP